MEIKILIIILLNKPFKWNINKFNKRVAQIKTDTLPPMDDDCLKYAFSYIMRFVAVLKFSTMYGACKTI